MKKIAIPISFLLLLSIFSVTEVFAATPCTSRGQCETDYKAHGGKFIDYAGCTYSPPAGKGPGARFICNNNINEPGAPVPAEPFDPLCADGKGVNTAIGCIPTDPQGFIAKFLGFAVGIAGGVAFLLILFGGLQILTSAGNPEKMNAGKELVTAAISGLLLIVFSVFLLRLIGYSILGIPGFG